MFFSGLPGPAERQPVGPHPPFEDDDYSLSPESGYVSPQTDPNPNFCIYV